MDQLVKAIANEISLLKWMAGFFGSGLGACFLWVRNVARRQADHEIKVAETYISKDDFKETKEDILRAIDSVKDLINKG